MSAEGIENKAITISRGPGNPAWLAGVSGNPGGRPKGLAALVRQETREGAELVEFMLRVLRGKRQPLRYKLEAVQWLADRGFGKALQQMEVSGPGAEPLTIRIEYAEASALDDADGHAG